VREEFPISTRGPRSAADPRGLRPLRAGHQFGVIRLSRRSADNFACELEGRPNDPGAQPQHLNFARLSKIITDTIRPCCPASSLGTGSGRNPGAVPHRRFRLRGLHFEVYQGGGAAIAGKPC
jgi:hypothetical protein